MASKFDTPAEIEQRETRKVNQHTHCDVHGCFRPGHIKFGSVWNCRYHDGVPGDRLGYVTLKLNNHSKEFDWYEYLLQTSVVDFSVGVVDATHVGQHTTFIPVKNAPLGMEPLPHEELREYRNRMRKRIEEILK